MDEKTLGKIEFDKISQMLDECCGSVLGKENAHRLAPGKDLHQIRSWLQETTEAKEIMRFNPSFSLGGIRDIRSNVERAALGAILEPEDLLDIADTCRAARKTKTFFSNLKGSYPLVMDLAKNLGLFKSMETAINEAVSDEGMILDTASDQLFVIRKKIRTYQERIKDKLDSLIKSPHIAKYLQDNLVTIRADRYVIPVKQEYRAQIPGLIHDQSASGATLFIEPMVVLEMNNELKKLKAAEHQEIILILKGLSQQVASFDQDLASTLRVLGRLDFIFAKARLSQIMDAGPPEINTFGAIKLVRARHPLIKGNVVPIDVDLGKNLDAMIITGPNTGGKTVTLKTIGLLHAMALSGLHVPANTGTEVCLFLNIFADIGDEQSIEQSLSTFSSHLVNIVRILTQSDEHALVLLDELGAGTDPTEGAALAMAILDYLQKRHVKVVATTHYSELKAFAYNSPRIVNASVEFDVKTLQPTYRLLMGVPGKSNAFEIARRLGLREDVINRASEFLTKDQVQVADLIANLEMDQRISEQERKEAETLRKELQAMERRLEDKETELHNREREIMRRAQEESLQVVRKTKEEMDRLYQELKTNLDAEAQKAQNKALTGAKEKIKGMEDKIYQALPEQKYTGKAPQTVMPGQLVEIPRLNQTGHVLSAPNQSGEVYVQAGIMKIAVKLDDLRLPISTEKKSGETRVGHLRMEKIRQVSPELDLRGMIVEEALEQMDKYLDDVFVAGLKEIRIIHGKGTGALREAITSHLKKHRQVKGFRLGDYNEGGTGVTLVSLNV
ncbi:endonuclease MutS2 [Candidatus Formimonas warabiya]|uniref:endonuclease MutS2 n=1 Tax=Formimonas warabiya TaxID=1761012 RepID=UPI0011D1223C|nr:endonuclease MutS2 [Candidatus Formimonas warabiya]